MGTPVPPGYPTLEDASWYKVTEDAYWDGNMAPGCRGAPVGRTSCCRLGAPIKAYIAGGSQCHFATFLCIAGSPAQKKIVGIKGPYENQAACINDL